jgi:hypothetical protein
MNLPRCQVVGGLSAGYEDEHRAGAWSAHFLVSFFLVYSDRLSFYSLYLLMTTWRALAVYSVQQSNLSQDEIYTARINSSVLSCWSRGGLSTRFHINFDTIIGDKLNIKRSSSNMDYHCWEGTSYSDAPRRRR